MPIRPKNNSRYPSLRRKRTDEECEEELKEMYTRYPLARDIRPKQSKKNKTTKYLKIARLFLYFYVIISFKIFYLSEKMIKEQTNND